MKFVVARVLANDRHPVHNPPEYEYVHRCNRCHDGDLLPRRNDVMQVIRQVPVKGHDGYIHPVHQNAEDGEKGAEPHDVPRVPT